MNCERCQSERVATLNAKSSDMNVISIGAVEHEGYVLNGFGIGSGDYIEFSWCLDCGKIQGINRLPLTDLEQGELDDEV